MYVNGYKYASERGLYLKVLPEHTVMASNLKVQRLDIRDTPQELFTKVQEQCENAFLLESSTGIERLADYSFIGYEPSMKIEANGSRVLVKDLERNTVDEIRASDPLHTIKKIVQSNMFASPFRFGGGAVGYIGYDSVRYWEKLSSGKKFCSSFPMMEFGIYLDGIVFDHKRGLKFYWYLGKSRYNELIKILKLDAVKGAVRFSKPQRSITKAKFGDMVERAKNYILSGDVFQVVLSKRFEFDYGGDLVRFYSELSRINPSPYMYFLKFGKRRVVGSSPEMLVRVDEGRVETFPIAGTRPKLRDPERNEILTRDLLSDPKELAEHTMLVDLARNDIGKVSAYGTVAVPSFASVHQFSHVQHIVSHVIGVLRRGLDSYDVIRAVFPAGTVSGAPKVRAMEIIDELEPDSREVYAGAVGYFSFNGNADFAIAIRTLLANGERCSVQAGAGIVADSQADREWNETEAKAAALLKSARQAEVGNR